MTKSEKLPMVTLQVDGILMVLKAADFHDFCKIVKGHRLKLETPDLNILLKRQGWEGIHEN